MAVETITIAQAVTLLKKYETCEIEGMTFAQFLETVEPTFSMDNAIIVQWQGIWVVIEKDGYAHT